MTASPLICLPETALLHNAGSLRQACDLVVHDGVDGPPELQRQPPVLDTFVAALDRVRDGAVIYVKTNMLEAFFGAVFPRLRARFVLVTAESDWAAPGDHRHHLDDPRIIRWFGQNCDLRSPHPKFEPLPLGFAEPHRLHGDQTVMRRVHLCMPSVLDKSVTAHASFHLTLSHPDRLDVWRMLDGAPGIVFEPRRIPPELLWVHHANHSFAISPRGAGYD